MEVLSQDQLKRLETHKYSSSGTSILEPIFQVFWRRLVEFFPMWIAPNTITIIGLAINIATSLMLIFYCPTALELAPSWIYFVNAIGLFIYQSLDAIDGKQARRTGSSSPLGELFDHGCDSISTVFVSLAVCIAMELGDYPWIMTIMCVLSYVLFYCGHWCSYVTGTLQFGKIDVTEVQFFIMIIFCISGIFGSGVWSCRLPLIGFELRIVIFFVWVVGLVGSMLRFGLIILFHEKKTTVAGTSVLSPGLNISVILAFALTIAVNSKYSLCRSHPVLYLLFVGIIFAKMTNRLVVAHMTKSKLQYYDITMLGMLLLFLNQIFCCGVKEYLLLWIFFIFSCLDLVLYLIFTYIQIASHLQIYIFSIESKPVQVQKKYSPDHSLDPLLDV